MAILHVQMSQETSLPQEDHFSPKNWLRDPNLNQIIIDYQRILEMLFPNLPILQIRTQRPHE